MKTTALETTMTDPQCAVCENGGLDTYKMGRLCQRCRDFFDDRRLIRIRKGRKTYFLNPDAPVDKLNAFRLFNENGIEIPSSGLLEQYTQVYEAANLWARSHYGDNCRVSDIDESAFEVRGNDAEDATIIPWEVARQ